MDKVSYDFGIDFGTTNSACFAFQEGQRPVYYGDSDGTPMPSIIIVDRISGEIIRGRKAWLIREESLQSCEVIQSVKSYLGTDKTWPIGGGIWTPERVAAEIFAGLKAQVVRRSNVEMKQATVAIPVGFSSRQRASLRRAAEQAGISITSFVNEPVAALFHNYKGIGHHTNIGVFDWGGGTLDVAIVENRKGRIRELAIDGLPIGGDLIDMQLAEWAHSEICNQNNMKISFDQMAAADRDLLLTKCEEAKRLLAEEDIAEIRLLKYGEAEYVHLELGIETMAQIIKYTVERAVECFEKCLQAARISLDQLGVILLVGGSVNLRPFQEIVESRWKGKCTYPEKAEWSIAGGAASLSRTPGHYKAATGFGLVMSDSSFFPLIEKEQQVYFDKPIHAVFALTEESAAANFIFAEEDGRPLRCKTAEVPGFGFFQEKFDLTARVDRDLIVNIEIKSRNRSIETKWRFNSLKLDYQLPVVDGDG